MKNIEKLAIDHVINGLKNEHDDKVEKLKEAKAAIDEAKTFFTGLAKGIISDVKDSVKSIEDEISEEGSTYFEEEVSKYFGFPFKLK